ncbi:hypothetical protein GALL_502600 [mine drainage metagenome]|uniref:Uncharacterized protein n=1 Tax=mine drainage metagenome TaxID=410659 RepID=A0A1J5PK20_9ZZZZ
MLAGPQVERHTRPAPVIDTQFHRDIGFGARVRIDILFLPVPGDAIGSGPILAAHRVLGVHGMHGGKHIGLAAAHGARVEPGRRFPRHHRQKLKHMVRHHVPQRAGFLVEPAAGFHPDGFGGGDLHMVDPVAVPQRFEHAVGEAQRHDVLNRLLAQEVVDPEYLMFLGNA